MLTRSSTGIEVDGVGTATVVVGLGADIGVVLDSLGGGSARITALGDGSSFAATTPTVTPTATTPIPTANNQTNERDLLNGSPPSALPGTCGEPVELSASTTVRPHDQSVLLGLFNHPRVA
jgi:hypothetical protein